MKTNKLLYILAGALLIGNSSCLKGDHMNIDTDNGPKNVVEFANTGDNVSGTNSTYPRFTTDLGAVEPGETVEFNVNISYSGVDVAPSDITVNLTVDPDALAKYNTENGSTFSNPPAEIYTMPTTAVIKKGTRQTQIKVGITNNASYDFNKNYALPLKIASTTHGIISGNFGKAMYSFSARNSYDGIYRMEATAPMVDASNAALVGWYPIDMQLITYTGNSIALYDGINYTNAYGHPIKNGASGSYYGSFSPVFFFDNSGNISSITNYFGQKAGGTFRSAFLDPNGVNKATFNPDGSIKSFEVSYIMTQSTGPLPTDPDVPRTYFHEKFTYVEAR